MDRVKAFNNAGAVCFRRGDVVVARELFKGALESNLARQRNTVGNKGGVGRSSSCHIAKAQRHLESMSDVQPEENDSTKKRCYIELSSVASTRHENVFLFTRPFEIDSEYLLASANTEEDTGVITKATAMIIFNLAMVEHPQNRSSTRVLKLYEYASALLDQACDDALGLALINNIGVWYYENSQLPAAKICMQHVFRALQATNVSLDDSLRDEMMSNVVCILMCPPVTASPAA